MRCPAGTTVLAGFVFWTILAAIFYAQEMPSTLWYLSGWAEGVNRTQLVTASEQHLAAAGSFASALPAGHHPASAQQRPQQQQQQQLAAAKGGAAHHTSPQHRQPPRPLRPAAVPPAHVGAPSHAAGAKAPELCRRRARHDAAIIYLAPARNSTTPKLGSDWDNMIGSLHSLGRLKDGGRAEVRIFYDQADRWSKRDLRELLDAAAPRDACAVEIEFARFPPGFDPATRSRGSKRSKWGYKHMCRFFFSDLFEKGLLRDYKYWMRMDTDSFIIKDVPLDPFAELDKHKGIGYLNYYPFKDCGDVAYGVPEMVENFTRRHGLKAPGLRAGKDARGDCVWGYYNNLEIGRVSAFQTQWMHKFREAVLASQGIYRHRWGDAILRWVSVQLFAAAKRVPPALERAYRHGKDAVKLKARPGRPAAR